jgi:hypothetical protein
MEPRRTRGARRKADSILSLGGPTRSGVSRQGRRGNLAFVRHSCEGRNPGLLIRRPRPERSRGINADLRRFPSGNRQPRTDNCSSTTDEHGWTRIRPKCGRVGWAVPTAGLRFTSPASHTTTCQPRMDTDKINSATAERNEKTQRGLRPEPKLPRAKHAKTAKKDAHRCLDPWRSLRLCAIYNPSFHRELHRSAGIIWKGFSVVAG